MNGKMQEEVLLVGASDYLHLQENADGFAYSVFRAGQPMKAASGQIYKEQIERSPIRSPVAAARTLAIDEAGLNGGSVAKVSVNMLERFLDSGVRRRRMFHPETLPEHDIRFITSDYKELFRIQDGGTIRVDYPDRHFTSHCEYLDDYHTRINGEVFHICQFAELLEKNNGTCHPEPEIMRNEAAWQLGFSKYLSIHACEGSWDYTIYDQEFRPLNDGLLDRPELSILEARDQIMKDFGMQNRRRTEIDYDLVMEKAENRMKKDEAAMDTDGAKKRSSVLGHLEAMKGNVGEMKVSVSKRQEEVL